VGRAATKQALLHCPALFPMAQFSIIIPVLNEASVIRQTLHPLQPSRQRGVEIIVVDGGSSDGTQKLAKLLADHVLSASKGRAQQMNRGAQCATGEYLLFLHADTRLPARWLSILTGVYERSAVWGRFDVRLSGRHWLLRVIETMMNWRSRVTGIATGDQAIFVRRVLFERIGGFPGIALMEDIVLSRRLKNCAAPLCLRDKVVTSSRRWEDNGILKTVLLMWWLRLQFYFGADTARLASVYSDSDSKKNRQS
jgi:rSAM/selenodomain-associated transferase 2